MSTPTPWTDAVYAKWQEGWDRTPFGPDLARTLERELYAVGATLASERGDHLRELAAERARLDWLLLDVVSRFDDAYYNRAAIDAAMKEGA